ncbi:MAG TPA: carbohydrate-binding protein [Tepidisphaeraceae bacterium]|nr:carbohydrate-binding protein [Tepidisphaeraceae bacterium]
MTYRPTSNRARALVVVEGLESRQLLAGDLPVSLHVNAGGPVVADSVARTFAADVGFTGGTVGTQAATDAQGLPADVTYNSFRAGTSFSFSHALADGNYAMFLQFADAAVTASGNRFSVVAEGKQILTDFDPQADGVGVAAARAFDVTVAGGAVDLQFNCTVGHAVISGIVLVPTDIPVEAQPYSWAGFDDVGRQVQSANTLRNIGSLIFLHRNENRNNYPAMLSDLVDGSTYPAMFASMRTDTLLPRGELSTLEVQAWAAVRQDYIYIPGPRLDTPDRVAAYENPARVAGDISVLFSDGHVELLARADAAARIGFDLNVPPTGGAPFRTTLRPDPHYQQNVANLNQIGRSLLTFANQNRQTYPLTAGLLVHTGATAATFHDPRGETPAPPAGMTTDETRAYIDASTDYRFLAGGLSAGQSSNMVLAYEDPARFTDGIYSLFANGRSEFREHRWAMETLRRSALRYEGGVTTTRPLAEIAGVSKTMTAGETIRLAGAGVPVRVARAGSEVPIVAYSWDFDYDGATFTADASEQAIAFTPQAIAGKPERTIALQVTDAQGRSGIRSISVTVNDPPPPPPSPTVVLQAETATLSGGTARQSQHVGFTGDSYADFAGSGSAIQWAVDRTDGETTTLTFRYANGDTKNRPLTIVVNGVSVGSVACVPTGSWTAWKMVPIVANLTAGTNTIRAVAGAAAGANVDALTIAVGDTPPPPTETSVVNLQAETATLAGGTSIATLHAGHTGAGYADFGGNGSSARFSVTRSAAGAARLDVRYANGGSANRPLAVTVNGVVVGTITCAPTGAWTTWKTVSINTSLAAGGNAIVLTATTTAGGSNIDSLTIVAVDPATPLPASPVTIQAEMATLGGGTFKSSTNGGYNGTGYADFTGANSYVQFDVHRTAAGDATLAVRYANGSTVTRSVRVTVNNAVVGTLPLGPTGSWTHWATASLTTALREGNNIVRVTAINDGPNLDGLTIA